MRRDCEYESKSSWFRNARLSSLVCTYVANLRTFHNRLFLLILLITSQLFPSPPWQPDLTWLPLSTYDYYYYRHLFANRRLNSCREKAIKNLDSSSSFSSSFLINSPSFIIQPKFTLYNSINHFFTIYRWLDTGQAKKQSSLIAQPNGLQINRESRKDKKVSLLLTTLLWHPLLHKYTIEYPLRENTIVHLSLPRFS